MAYDSEVLRRATARLEEQNARRRREQDELRARAYRQLPRVAEIDRELRRTMAEVVSTAASWAARWSCPGASLSCRSLT